MLLQNRLAHLFKCCFRVHGFHRSQTPRPASAIPRWRVVGKIGRVSHSPFNRIRIRIVILSCRRDFFELFIVHTAAVSRLSPPPAARAARHCSVSLPCIRFGASNGIRISIVLSAVLSFTLARIRGPPPAVDARQYCPHLCRRFAHTLARRAAGQLPPRGRSLPR